MSDPQHVQSLTLSELVLLVADHPTKENHEAFLTAFVQTRVGFRIPKELGPVQAGTRITTSKDKFAIPNAISPEGERMLVVIADIPMVARREPGVSFGELAAIDVIKMAISNSMGIIVQALGERSAWTAIRREQVIRLARVS